MAGPLSGLRGFLNELRRRRVGRVAVAYAVVTFVVLQVADIVVPALRFPEWTTTVLIFAALLGFPIAVVLAWVFDITPQGVRRTLPGGAEPEAERRALRLSPEAVLFIAGLVLVGGAGWWFLRSGAGGHAGTDRGKVVAVLPFQNLSDADNEFFAAGIHDDILSQLARIADLRVISRTSVMQYAQTDKDMRTIAAELGAGTVLAGSVRRAGGRIRVVTQLVDAQVDEHLWTETFDRELTAGNVFAIQSEIAEHVARALRAELSADERKLIETRPTEDLVAYEYYLQGTSRMADNFRRESAERAAEFLELAVETDPGFALAWALLSRQRSWLASFHHVGSARSGALAAVDQAVQLAPDAPATQLARGYYRYWVERDYDRALDDFFTAERLEPNDADVLAAIGYIQRRRGRFEEAVARLVRATDLDPLNYAYWLSLADSYVLVRGFDAAEQAFDRAIRAAPDVGVIYLEKFDMHLESRWDTAAARRVLEEFPESVDPEAVAHRSRQLAARKALMERDFEGAIELYTRGFRFRPYESIAELYHLLGRSELERAYGDSLRTVMERRRAAIDTPSDSAFDYRLVVIHASLGKAYAFLGDKERAVEEGKRATELLPRSLDAVAAMRFQENLADIHVLVGEPERAIDQLEFLLSIPSSTTVERLRHHPLYDPLRGHPRFTALTAVSE